MHIKKVHQTHDASSLKRHFLRFPWNPEVNPWHDLKATHNTFRVIVCTFETLFFRQSFSKELYLSFVFLRGHGNESCNLIGYQCGSCFPIFAHGYGAAWASRFVANFRKFISFCRLDSIFKQIIWKQIKPINKLLIFSFSHSNRFVFLQKKKEMVLRWILVANMSLNGLTCGLKAVCN